MRYVILIFLPSLLAASFSVPPKHISVFLEHHYGQDALVFWQEGTKWICRTSHSPYRILKDSPISLIETLLLLPEKKECGEFDRLKLIDRMAKEFRSNVLCLDQLQAKKAFQELQAICDR